MCTFILSSLTINILNEYTFDIKLFVIENACNGRDLASGYTPTGTQQVATITIDGSNGEITLDYITEIDNGATLIFTPTVNSVALVSGTPPAGTIDWGCTDGTLQDKYRPSICR